MKKINTITTKIQNSCGKKGCKIYVLPYASTKEAFEKFVDHCVRDQKVTQEELQQI